MAAMEFQHRLQRAGNSTLYVRHFQSPQGGPLVLYLHGIGDWGDSFEGLAAGLGDAASALIPDLRGHGFSQRQAAYGLVDYSADIRALVEEHGQPLYIYGHSLGGLVALAVASELPELVRACVCEDPPLFHLRHSIHQRPEVYAAFAQTRDLLLAHQDPAQMLAAMAAAAPDRDLSKVRQRAQQWLRMDPMVWEPVLGDRLCAGAENLRVSCPVHLLGADPAYGAALAAGDELMAAAHCPQLNLQRFAGAGHNLRASHFAEVQQALNQVLMS